MRGGTPAFDAPYDNAVLARLPQLAGAIGLLYAARGVPYALIYQGREQNVLIAIALGTAGVLAVLSWLAGTRRLPASGWQQGAGVIIFTVAVETVLRVGITREAWQCMDLMLAIIAAAATMNSARWFAATVVANWVALLAAFAISLPLDIQRPGDRLIWPYVLLAAATSTLLAAVFRASRMSAFAELTDARELAERVSLEDLLTGLANRRGLELSARRVVATARRAALQVHCVFVDVDSFKQINDTAGHGVGDEVLVSVAQALRAVVRPDDVVARWAGDEFVVIGVGHGISPGDLEKRVAARLAGSSELVPAVWPGVISAGGAVTSPDAVGDLDALLSAADHDMYRRRDRRRVAAAAGGPIVEPRAAPETSPG